MSDTQVFSSAKPNTCGGAGFDRFHENGRASYRIQGKRIQNVSIDLASKITTAAIFGSMGFAQYSLSSNQASE